MESELAMHLERLQVRNPSTRPIKFAALITSIIALTKSTLGINNKLCGTTL